MANITKRGGTYRIRVSCGYDVEGKQRTATKTWIPPEGMSEKRAEKEAQRIAVQFEDDCRDGAAFTAVKFGVFLDQWFEECAQIKLKAQSITSYQRLATRVRAELGHLRLDKLTTRDVQRFIGKLAVTECRRGNGETLSAKTIKDYVSLVSSAYDYAVKMQLVPRNPCNGVTLPRKESYEREILTLEQTQKLLNILGQEEGENLQLAVFITLAIYTGLRRGELLGLLWSDINFTHGLLSVRRAAYYAKGRGAYIDTPKTKSSLRTLRFSGEAMVRLKEYRAWQERYAASLCDKWQDGGRVFTNWCGEQMYTNAPERYFKRICEQNGLPRVSLHSLRHFNASILINAGLDIKTVQAALGHSSATTTLDIYAHEFQMAQAIVSAAVTNALESTFAV